ncbi:MAG: Ycf66 family protein [Phormidesmis sp.]
MLGTPVSLLIGLILILGSVGLFFLDKIKPTYARDSDKVYAVFILIAGILALTHWEINIGESFQMLLMAGMLTTLMIENIRTRDPKLPAPPQSYDNNRPPRPRYNEAPPVRRGYRAELDDRATPGFRGEPARAPRMAPAAQAQYWNDAPRQPYEEYRGPVGRLQPSPANVGGPDMRSPDLRSPDLRSPENRPEAPMGNQFDDRYGERPPARPPVSRPPEQNGRGAAPDNYTQRPPQRPPEQANGPRGVNQAGGWESDSRQRSAAAINAPTSAPTAGSTNGNRPPKSERALNVRPLSEAPKIDLPAENA